MAFFGGSFAERVREFTREHDDTHVRLKVVTLTGERLDARTFAQPRPDQSVHPR